MAAGTSISPLSDVEPGSLDAGTNTDIAGDMTGTGGGVAVRGGRGSDLGTVGGGMSGGSFGGSRESDLGGGLSGGTRSGTGTDASGGIGTSDDEAEQGDHQRRPHRKSRS